MFPLGDYTTADTLYLPFDTYDSDRASVTITGLAVTDIEIYKDGGTTPRASDNGYALLDTDGIDFAGAVGLHGFSVDLSDNSDAGFYAAGSTYWINVDAITVDGQTVRFTYHFTIGRLLKPTTAGRTFDVSATGEGGLDFDNIKDASGAHTLTNITVPNVTLVATTTTNTDMVGTDNAALAATALSTATWTAARAGALTDWIDGGRLDLLLDAASTHSAADVVNEWETQSQADPTGFHVNVQEWVGNAVDHSGSYPEVDVRSWDGENVSTNSNNVPEVALTDIMDTALTETGGQLAGRFVDFFDQASAVFSVATALADFKAAGFSTHSAANVWAAGARTLTASTNFNDPSAAAIADAVWDEAAAGHTDAGKAGQQQWTDIDAILADTGTDGVVVTAASKTGYALTAGERTSIANALLDLANGIESGVTPKQALQRMAAVIAGKVSGAGTGTEIFVGLDGVTTRATATVDVDGNRTGWVYV